MPITALFGSYGGLRGDGDVNFGSAFLAGAGGPLVGVSNRGPRSIYTPAASRGAFDGLGGESEASLPLSLRVGFGAGLASLVREHCCGDFLSEGDGPLASTVPLRISFGAASVTGADLC